MLPHVGLEKTSNLDSSVRRLFPLRFQSPRFLEKPLTHVGAWFLDHERQQTGKNLTKLGPGCDPCLPEIVAVDDEVAEVHRLPQRRAQASAVQPMHSLRRRHITLLQRQRASR